MYMNLHTLPADSAMLTLYITTDEEGTPRNETSAEEIDVVLPRRLRGRDAIMNSEPVKAELRGVFGDEWTDTRVVGIVNQSDGFVVYDGFDNE